MLTRCPNPRCKLSFEVPDDRQGKNGPCPSCGQVITFRSLEVILEVERQHAKQAQTQKSAPAGTVAFSAVLEDIRSLWNVGSIFRSADGAGFGRLYLCGITGTPPNKKIAKTSLGAEDVISWQHHSHVLDFLPKLADEGVQIVALEKTESSIELSEALRQRRLRTPLCMIIGNEVAGVSAEALGLAQITCHLPMHGVKSSLNVAVAFGIAAYQIVETGVSTDRQR
jgi:tRNA G18 (ribose-2'-O)-methylase SpoU